MPTVPRRSQALLALAAASVAFGCAVQVGDHALGPFRAVVWLGAPWLLLAFAIGAVAGRPLRGAAAGGAALTIATSAYYLLVAAHGSVLYAAAMTVAWGATAAVVGAVFGAAGAVWRGRTTDTRLAAVAGTVPGSAAAAEGVLLLGSWTGPGAMVVLLGEVVVGVGLTLVHARRSAHLGVALVAALALFAAFGLAEQEVRGALRGVGWAGP